MGQQSTFGVGDRPEYGQEQKDWSVSPDNYGDVSQQLSAARRGRLYDISVKERRKERETEGRSPGPKYDVRIPCGQSGWSRGSKNPKWTICTRHLDVAVYNDAASKPGPAEYTTQKKPGTNPPLNYGTLYDISFKNRYVESIKQKSPGPGQYSLKRVCDQYNVTPNFKHKSY